MWLLGPIFPIFPIFALKKTLKNLSEDVRLHLRNFPDVLEDSNAQKAFVIFYVINQM